MYYIELIRFEAGQATSEGLPPVEPNLETVEAAIAAGHRVFSSRGHDPSIPNYPDANGFRVKRRSSDEIEHVWVEDV